jgi:predicted DNA binding CopG/RHH family protein
MAADVLALHLGGLEQDGEAIPEPSFLEAVITNPKNCDGVAILVAAPEFAAKTIRINITLPEDVLMAIDRYADANGYSRSGFLAKAAKMAIAA